MARRARRQAHTPRPQKASSSGCRPRPVPTHQALSSSLGPACQAHRLRGHPRRAARHRAAAGTAGVDRVRDARVVAARAGRRRHVTHREARALAAGSQPARAAAVVVVVGERRRARASRRAAERA
eukprot:882776-Prymnesium_polylepis.2